MHSKIQVIDTSPNQNISEGEEILKLMILKNPELVQSISADVLLDRPPACKTDTSPDQNIPDGLEILELIFLKNPELVQSISADVEGKEILKLMILKNPELVQSMSADVLFDRYVTSACHTLSTTADGQKILEMFGAHNQELDKQLDKNNLKQSYPSKTGIFSKSGGIPYNERSETNENLSENRP